MATKTWRVYMYTFPNGKKYIGVTCRTLHQRQGKNFRNYKGCRSLWEAIKEFGPDSIKEEILVEGEFTLEEASALEQKYISEYESDNPEKGYNTCHGGEGLEKNISDERREHLSAQMKNLSTSNIGKKHSEETRHKQSLAKLGKKRGPVSEETRAKISRANSRENMTEETHLRRQRSKQKKVIAVNKTTGERMEFRSGSDVATFFGVKSSTVSRWIKGKRKPSVDYVFSFSTNND